jgi:hypothetical protein
VKPRAKKYVEAFVRGVGLGCETWSVGEDVEAYRHSVDRAMVLLLIVADELQKSGGHWTTAETYLDERARDVLEEIKR